MSNSSFTIELVPQPTENQLTRIEEIYTVSFPPEVRISFDKVCANIRARQRDLYLVNQGRIPIGFALVARFRTSQAGYGEYIAIAPEYRNQGAGSALLQHLWNVLRESRIPGFIFEVDPEDEGIGEERQLRKRRIGFYQRNGAALVNCAPVYVMPDLNGPGSLRLRLMWIPLSDGPQELHGELLRSCICDLYMQIYERGPDDPLLQAILEQLVC